MTPYIAEIRTKCLFCSIDIKKDQKCVKLDKEIYCSGSCAIDDVYGSKDETYTETPINRPKGRPRKDSVCQPQ